MITIIEIRGLRGIGEGKIEGLAPLTILVGPNGCGKSTVLEALGVACAGASASSAYRALAAREWLGLQGMNFWLDEQKGANVRVSRNQLERTSHLAIVVAGDGDREAARREGARGELRALTINVTEKPEQGPGNALFSNVSDRVTVDDDGIGFTRQHEATGELPFSLNAAFVDRPAGALRRLSASRFSSELRDALTAIKLKPWYEQLIKNLLVLRPSLDSIESLAVGDRDEPFMFEKDPRRGYPLAYAGDGFRRALLLAATFAQAKGGVAALDEPEAFAHPRLFAALAGLIRGAIADGTQVVIATHSLEFVAVALAEFERDPEKVAVIGLRMGQCKLDPVVIAGPDAYRRVVDLRDDLRL